MIVDRPALLLFPCRYVFQLLPLFDLWLLAWFRTPVASALMDKWPLYTLATLLNLDVSI